MSENTNNPVYKLVTNLQLVLINVLITLFWTLNFHKVV